ncbi:MBL fold metallo-hydrolase [Holzapfeliella sp. JNUCC 80]
MKLTVLGIYGGYPYAGAASSSYLLQSEDGFNLLLDAGSGSLLALEKYLDPFELDAVLLSHYHHDHASDIGVLQYYYQLHPGEKRQAVLPIYGHNQDFISFANLSMDGITKGYPYFDYQPLDLGPFEINFLRTQHPVPAYAMRIKEKATGKVFVFTADTAYFDDLVEFSQGADLLLTDTNFAKDKTGRKWHMTSEESANLAQKAGVKSLLLSHLPQTISHSQLLNEAREIFVNAEIAEVGMTQKV